MTPPAGGHVPGSHMAGLGAPRHHIVTAMVENKAGVLARVASLFSRRGINIFSLAVAPTDDDRFSRITIVVEVESAEEVAPAIEKANGIDDRPVVIDFRTDAFEKVYPMVPAGASNDDVIVGPSAGEGGR